MFSKRCAVTPWALGYTKPCYQSTGNGTGGLGWQKKSYWIGLQTISALVCSIFVKWKSYQPRLYFSWISCKPCWRQITPGHQYCLHATNHHIIFATSGPGGNSNLIAYYLCHTFINWWEFWTGHTKQTNITGAHSTFWRALITSMQLGKNCQ